MLFSDTFAEYIDTFEAEKDGSIRLIMGETLRPSEGKVEVFSWTVGLCVQLFLGYEGCHCCMPSTGLHCSKDYICTLHSKVAVND